MLQTIPKTAFLTQGTGCGHSELVAFDSALLNAGIGNLNLVKISSILPPHCKVFQPKGEPVQLAAGSVVPAVFSYKVSNVPGQTIACAIAIGISDDPSNPGVIFESNLVGTAVEALDLARSMVREALEVRTIKLSKLFETSSEITVTSIGIYSAVVSAVLLV